MTEELLPVVGIDWSNGKDETALSIGYQKNGINKICAVITGEDAEEFYKAWNTRHTEQEPVGMDAIDDVIDIIGKLITVIIFNIDIDICPYLAKAILGLQSFKRDKVCVDRDKLESMRKATKDFFDVERAAEVDGYNACIDELIQNAKEK